MSVVLKEIDIARLEEVTNDNLVPVSDEELEEIIEELGKAFDRAIENEPEPELPPEIDEILATEDMTERAKLYKKYYDIIFPEK